MTPRKPVWTEGLFVTQHHFQQLDRYHEALVTERLRAALPYDWGVLEIEVDARALAAEEFRLLRLAAVLPDGTVVAVGGATASRQGDSIAPRSFAGIFTPRMAALDVHVALTAATEASATVDLDGRATVPLRYVREHSSVVDTNTGTSELSVPHGRPNLQILFGDERRDGFDAIRIAQLARATTGAALLKEAFIPPSLRVRASGYLLGRFRTLLGALTAKQRSLAESRRQRTAAAVDFQASDAAKFWLLHALNVSIPPIAHIVDQGTSHPEAAYLNLAQLIGQLCTFAVDGDPSTTPKFNYLEMGEMFTIMFDRAHQLLDTVIAERYIEIPLTRRPDGMHLGEIKDGNLLRSAKFFLAASGSAPEAQLRDRLPKLAKIASWSQIGSILNSAVNGVRIELEYTPPGALPIRPGVVFFQLQRTPDYWNDLAGTGSIAIYHPIDPQTIRLQLYAVDPSNLR